MRMPVKHWAVSLWVAGFVGMATAAADHDLADLNHARRLIDAKQLDEAAAVLRRVIEHSPHEGDAHRLLGHTYWELGRKEDARRALARAVESGALSPDVLTRLARLDQQSGRESALLSALQWLALIEPDNLPWQLLTADVFASAGRVTEAQQVLDRAIAASPTDPEIFLRQGNLSLQQGNKRQATLAFERAYFLGAASDELAETIAELWFALDLPEQAVTWYTRARGSLAEGSGPSRLRLAQMYFAAGDLDQARTIAERTIAAEPDDGDGARLLLGQIALKGGDPQKAIEHWRPLADSGRATPQVLEYLGSQFFNTGNHTLAAVYLQKRLEQGAADEKVLRYLILCLIHTQRLDLVDDRLRDYIADFGLNEQAQSLIRLWVEAESAG